MSPYPPLTLIVLYGDQEISKKWLLEEMAKKRLDRAALAWAGLGLGWARAGLGSAWAR